MASEEIISGYESSRVFLLLDLRMNQGNNDLALQHGGIISLFELAEPSLTDIFIEYVGKTALPDAPSALSA